jgi:hypothetical protein
MWPFGQKSVVVPVSANVRISLTKQRGMSDTGVDSLRMVQERGNYAGRSVTYFRVFDPSNAKWGTVELYKYNDLDVRRILHSGHAEKDGVIVLDRQSSEA